MNSGKICAIPQYDFAACGDVQERYNTLAKERLCPWFRTRGSGPFDYSEVFEQMYLVKTQFSEETQSYVLAHCESLFARNVLLPEILNWGVKRPHISLIAVLYTMPTDSQPRHLVAVALDTNPTIGQPNGTIFGKMSTDFGNFAITQSFKISDFEHPDRAKVEYLSLK
jgi:hypothetical protein